MATGLELGLAAYLAGKPGQARKIMSGRLQEELGQVVLQEPVHGQSLVLTLDADLQAICERRLGEAVARVRRRGRFGADPGPEDGDILAAASWPLLDRRTRSSATRGLEQPQLHGSTNRARSSRSSPRPACCATGPSTPPPSSTAPNRDFGGYPIATMAGTSTATCRLMRAFSKSSNIYFARAVGNLSDERILPGPVDFGFGQTTTLPYPGQPRGILHTPAAWSGRSKPTIAIGQEIAVTPLQLGLASCAVANGGTLYAPRLVSEVQDEAAGSLETDPPVPLRRVMAEPLAALLREAMARVSRRNRQGARTWTGSASAARPAPPRKPRRHGVTRRAPTWPALRASSPLEDPRLVILTVLDEPQGFRTYYAAQSAVPLFSGVVRDIRQSTGWLDDVPGGRTAPMPSLEQRPP